MDVGLSLILEDDFACCALDEDHDGPCAWLCPDCDGAGCPNCQDGMVTGVRSTSL